MPNKTIDALVFCPFYISENDRSITCEALIGGTGCSSVHRFPTRERKVAHELDFCTGRTCVNCPVFMALDANDPEGREPYDFDCF